MNFSFTIHRWVLGVSLYSRCLTFNGKREYLNHTATDRSSFSCNMASFYAQFMQPFSLLIKCPYLPSFLNRISPPSSMKQCRRERPSCLLLHHNFAGKRETGLLRAARRSQRMRQNARRRRGGSEKPSNSRYRVTKENTQQLFELPAKSRRFSGDHKGQEIREAWKVNVKSTTHS